MGEDAKEPTLVEESNLLTSSDSVQKRKCQVEDVRTNPEDDVTIEKTVIVENTVTEEGDRGKLGVFAGFCSLWGRDFLPFFLRHQLKGGNSEALNQGPKLKHLPPNLIW